MMKSLIFLIESYKDTLFNGGPTPFNMPSMFMEKGNPEFREHIQHSYTYQKLFDVEKASDDVSYISDKSFNKLTIVNRNFPRFSINSSRVPELQGITIFI